jgi:hypothetical protein
MLPNVSPAELRLQAKSIVSVGKPAKAAWSELKSWAYDKGPVALRSAAMEFISVYGRSPEAQFLMPEVMRSSSGFMPFPQMPSVFDFRLQAKPDFRAVKPIFNFEKQAPKAPMERLEMKTMMELPKRAALTEQLHFDSSKSPDTHALSANQGHSIVHSLIHKIRSHASEHLYLGERPKAAAKNARKPAKAARSKPVKKKAKKKPVRARKAAKKALRKTKARRPVKTSRKRRK